MKILARLSIGKTLGVLVFLLLTTAVLIYPLFPVITTMFAGDGGDNFQFVGFQFLAHLLLSHGYFPFTWTNFWRYPAGVDFQNIYDSNLFIFLGVFLYQFTQNAALVYNLSVIFLLAFNLWLTYISLRSFFSLFPSLIGTVIYGASFFELARLAGHPNLLLSSCFLFFLFVMRKLYQTQGNWQSILLFGLSIVLLYASSLQYPLIFLSGLLFLIPIGYIFYPRVCTKLLLIIDKRAILLGISFIAAFAGFFLVQGDKIVSIFTNDLQLPTQVLTKVDAINFFVPNHYVYSLIGESHNGSVSGIESGAVFIGYIELLLFIISLFVVTNTRYKLFLATLVAVFFILSLGTQTILPQIWPYQYFFLSFPFRGITEPGRFILLLLIPMLFLILTMLEQVKNKKIFVLLLLLLLLERLPIHFPLRSGVDERYMIPVRQLSSSAVLDLPIFTDWWNGSLYDYLSIRYQKPIVNGYIHWSGNTLKSQEFITFLSSYDCQNNTSPTDATSLAEITKTTIGQLQKHAIRTVVIHNDLNQNAQCKVANIYSRNLVKDSTQWKEVYADEKTQVYQLQ